MKPGIPWSVKGIDGKAREVAKDAARAEGMTLGEWLNHKILESAQEDAELKSRATRTKASSSVSRRPGKRAPRAAARTAPEAASEAIAGTFEDKFDELFERIASLQASPATTHAGTGHAAAIFDQHHCHGKTAGSAGVRRTAHP
jgi:localization factor PodJL